MKGRVNDWKQARDHAKANAQNYEDRFQAMHADGQRPSTGEWKGTEFRRQAWQRVAVSIAEALRLEALPTYKT